MVRNPQPGNKAEDKCLFLPSPDVVRPPNPNHIKKGWEPGLDGFNADWRDLTLSSSELLIVASFG